MNRTIKNTIVKIIFNQLCKNLYLCRKTHRFRFSGCLLRHRHLLLFLIYIKKLFLITKKNFSTNKIPNNTTDHKK